MGGRLRHQAGGIVSLVALLEEHGEAVEYELIRLGLRLRDLPSRTFDWRDLWSIIKSLPEDSAIHRALEVIDEDSIWTPHMMLTAEILDLAAYLVWFQTKDGQNGRNRPKPYPRPGYRPEEPFAPLPAEEMLAWLGWDVPDTIAPLEDLMRAQERDEAPRTRTKLTEDDVRAIRADTGASQAAVAARYGVSASTVNAVISRRTWQHVN